ncbi:hypothetical protein ACGFYQ_34295 [Streptomyces sp. NPDC048258]|uniref:hypothetical protein n=1 Tax=Streptomyces sp. NPDC048258 TaxID=3365527 RepID=UPI003711C34D
MVEEQETAAEITRLASMRPDAFKDAVVRFVTGGTDRRSSRTVQWQALTSPTLASRTLDVLEGALRQARVLVPRAEDESKSAHQARVVAFRSEIQAAMPPLHDVVEELARQEIKHLLALDDETFARRWTAFVVQEKNSGPVPRRVQGLAFRSPRVAPRAEALCRLMEEEPARFMAPAAPREGRGAHDARVIEFRRRVASEERFLQYAIQFAEARQGRMPSAPNYRQQALRLLGKAHPQELSKLLHDVRAEAREAKAEARREGRMARRNSGKGAR